MQYQANSVTPLINFEIDELNKDEILLSKDIFLAKTPEILFNDSLQRILSRNDYRLLSDSNYSFIHKYEPQENCHIGTKEAQSRSLQNIALLALWLTKRTFASCSHTFYFREPDDINKSTLIEPTKNSFVPLESYEKSNYTLSDVEKLKISLEKISRIYCEKDSLIITFYYLITSLRDYEWISRFAMLTTVIESIFSTDSQEISHKISERIAYFLEDTGIKRKEVYDKTKELYAIRSKIVHGSNVSKYIGDISITKLEELEEIVYKSLNKIIFDDKIYEIFTSKRKEEYFKNLILGNL